MTQAIKLSFPETREFWEIPILFEDEHLLALDKPNGLLVSPDRQDLNRPCLIKLLHQAIADAKPWARERGLTYLMNAHRPDAEASGILLLAKSKPVLVSLANFFSSDKPCRRYLALVKGSPANETFELSAPVGPHPTRPGVMQIDPKGGKKSRTQFRILEGFAGWTLLQAEAVTERTHQIRVHLRHLGLPVVGDILYGGRPLWLSRLKPDFHLKPGHEERALLSRPALHAAELDLPHPVTGAPLEIRSPWPKDLTVAIKYLRRYGI